MAKQHYHAVMIDETGCEFGAGCYAESYDDARQQLREDYPESSIAQLETKEDTQKREEAMYARLQEELDY